MLKLLLVVVWYPFFGDSVESGAVMNSGDSLKTIVATPDLIKEMVYAASVPDSVPVAD